MRDKRFIAEHRGGPLSKDRHHLLCGWARDCAEHVFPLIDGKIDKRLEVALSVAERWRRGEASVGEAQKASLAAHAADHSLGPALYALKAVKSAGGSVEAERRWQKKRLPPEVRELVLTTEKYKYIEGLT